ncbi:MAG: low molecular weight phosphatase family protein [Candidatus Hodarchaeota archaeon]
MSTKSILFVCIHNAGRSQMAAAFAQKYGKGKITADSGGTHPSEKVHDIVVEVMLEKGIDIFNNKPRRITASELHDAAHVIVMGCEVEKFCPAPLLHRVIHWAIEDPKGQSIMKVREIRDAIEKKVKQFIDSLNKIDN